MLETRDFLQGLCALLADSGIEDINLRSTSDIKGLYAVFEYLSFRVDNDTIPRYLKRSWVRIRNDLMPSNVGLFETVEHALRDFYLTKKLSHERFDISAFKGKCNNFVQNPVEKSFVLEAAKQYTSQITSPY